MSATMHDSHDPHDPDVPPAKLDAYFDGSLVGEELAAFEAELARSPELRAQVELQGRMDSSLKALFPSQAVSLDPEVLRAAPAAPWRRSTSYKLVMLATAAALLLASGVFVYSTLSTPDMSLRDIGPDALYAKVVDAGFTPQWKCNNDAEFAESVRYRLGQPLLVAAAVPGLDVLGWAYPDKYHATPLTDRTMILLSTVGGDRVVVFVDRAAADKPLETKPASKLHLFKRQIGELMLYEVTPREKPVVIEAMYKPDTMPGAKPQEPGSGPG